MRRHTFSIAHRAHLTAKRVARRSLLPWAVVATLGSVVAACAPSIGTNHSQPVEAAFPQGDHVFEGSAVGVPDSTGRLVLEENFEQTRRLRWQNDDAGYGAVDVDFFEPQEWEVQGEPAKVLIFSDRSPGPILFGTVLLAPFNKAEVNVVIGANRVKFVLNRVEH